MLTTRGQKALARNVVIATLGAVLLLPSVAKAEDLLQTLSLLAHNESAIQVPPGTLMAQNDTDDAYDPFADYSEFEESMDEEEDINFFRNGRLLTMGFMGGYRGWTQTLGTIYSGNGSFGLFLAYFFDLRFALQLGYLSSSHTLVVKGSGFDPVQGTIDISDIQVLLKYYFNTQNVTRGLADLNPYLVAGFSQIYRTQTIAGDTTDGSPNTAKDSAFAFDIGAGIEIPMARNKMFFGLQAMYQLVNFGDEANIIEDDQGVKTGVSPAGDAYLVTAILGINF